MPTADHGLRPHAESPQSNFVSKHPQVTALLKAAAVAMCIGSLAFTTNALADGDAASTGWNGTAGAGPLVFPKYVGGKQTKAWLIPLLSINYNDTYYIELQRAGVYLVASDDKKIGLGFAIEPRFGYATTDGNLLRGMVTRRTSIEGGLPSIGISTWSRSALPGSVISIDRAVGNPHAPRPMRRS